MIDKASADRAPTRSARPRPALLLAGLAVVALAAGCGADVPATTSGGEKIIVSGASGRLGGLVVDQLLARGVPAGDLILVSRTPERLERYRRQGASTRFGDFTQPESLPAAYAGGQRMLLISIGGGRSDRPQLHKNAIDAAVAAGIERIAYTSYVNADRYDASSLAVDHRLTEQYLFESGVAWTLLRNQIYADGLVDQAVDAISDGRLVTHLPDARVAYVTREDCAAAAAAVLVTDGHDNRAYNITGPGLIGPREIAALAAELSGHAVELLALDEADYIDYLTAAGLPEAAVRGTLSFAEELDSPYLREISSAVPDLTGRPAVSVRDLFEAARDRLIAAGG